MDAFGGPGSRESSTSGDRRCSKPESMRPSRFLSLLLLALLVVMSLAQDSPDEDPNRAFSRANEAAEAAAAAADGVEAATPAKVGRMYPYHIGRKR